MRHLMSVALSLSMLGTALAGDIYCDPHGHDCTDRPTPGWVLVRGDQPRRPDDSGSSNTTPGASTTLKPPTDASANSQIETAKARQAMQSDMASKRAEQCKQAQDRYQKDIEYRRLYRVDKDGNQTFLSDDEADNERVKAKIDVDTYCSSGGSGQ